MAPRNINFLLILLTILSCTTNKESDLQGRWKLVEVLADPGDGSGTFQPTNEDKYLQFNADFSLESNRSHCLFGQDSESGTLGFYSLEAGEIYFSCDGESTEYSFQLIDGDLILNFPRCIEPCQEKYRKLR